MNAEGKRESGRRNPVILVAAALTIAAGGLSILNGLEGLFGSGTISSFIPETAAGVVPVCGVLLLIFGFVAITGGVYSLRIHPHTTLPLVGAALGMLGGGYFGFWMGLAAIVLYWLSNEDF